jgi:hypothetical protein
MNYKLLTNSFSNENYRLETAKGLQTTKRCFVF